ncbi:MAG: lecithin retinol acyltransferase family protein [Pirellulaceae bacterium]|nr:lecithin retinol acyltransferase family protein [Pirellulaceae bacterium]
MNSYQVGDHLYVDCGGYSHHGIYIGGGRVIHFDSTPVRKLMGSLHGAPPRIVEVSLADFHEGKPAHIRVYPSNDDAQKSERTLMSSDRFSDELFLEPAGNLCHPRQQVVDRAKSRLGETGYDLFNNNCEHFAVWCKTGCQRSSQVESARRVGRSGAAGLAAGAAIFRSARLIPGPYRIMAYGAGAAVVLGSTTYRIVSERRNNRNTGQS